MTNRIFIRNGSGQSENYHFETDGSPHCWDGSRALFQRFLVRKLPSGEHLPCGRVTLKIKGAQQYVEADTLERLYLEQEAKR